MLECDQCGVGFTGELPSCPLCGAPLRGEAVPSPFPASHVRRTSRLARRALLAIAAAAVAAIVALGAAFALSPWALAMACLAVAVTYGFLRNALVHAPDFLRVAERWFLALLAVAVLWWLAYGSPWVAALAVPGVCVAALATNSVLVVLYRGAFVHGYAKYLLYDFVLGFAPLALLPFGAAAWPWLVVASAAMGVVLGTLVALLARRQLVSELRKLLSA